MQQFIHLLDRILRTSVRTVAESVRLQIGNSGFVVGR
jgi:hypothetical protein